MSNSEDKKNGADAVVETPSYQRFARDKRVRTTSAVRVEPVSKRRNAETADNEHYQYGRYDHQAGRSYDRNQTQHPHRSSYNPNFTEDNRPRFRTDNAPSDQRKPYQRRAEQDFNREPYHRDFNRQEPRGDRFNRNDFNRDGDSRNRYQHRDFNREAEHRSFNRDFNCDNDRGSFNRDSRNEDFNRNDFNRDNARRDFNREDSRRTYTRERDFNRDDSRRTPKHPAEYRDFNRQEGFDRNSAGRDFREERQPRTTGPRSYGRRPQFADDQPRKQGYSHSYDKTPQRDERPRTQQPKKAAQHKTVYGAGEVPQSYPRFTAPKQEGEIRLNRYIAQSGMCSRREADEFIAAGVVTVNGQVVTEMGTKVKPTDEVRFNGEPLHSEKKVYILMNKPKGFVTTIEDEHAAKTVMDIVKGACAERIYPVGRLDKNSLGVLLLTNDGDLTKTLTHPSYNKRKIYQVTLDKPLTKADMEQIVEGIDLEDGKIQADEVSYVNDSKKEIGIEIHSGRNRIVRRIFEHLGYRVSKLDRVYFAGLTKKNLKRGQWRFLTPQEVAILKAGMYE